MKLKLLCRLFTVFVKLQKKSHSTLQSYKLHLHIEWTKADEKKPKLINFAGFENLCYQTGQFQLNKNRQQSLFNKKSDPSLKNYEPNFSI